MIDHISIGVSDLERSKQFYAQVLATLGYTQLRDWPGAAAGFGKRHPEFWINYRPGYSATDNGAHVCLRAPSIEAVEAFHAAALAFGGLSEGAPGPRPEYSASYYAAFVRDPDGNKIEAVTFVQPGG